MPKGGNTHQEIEVKVRVADVTRLLARLNAIGAKPMGRVLERNVVFDTDKGDLRLAKRLLRLRTEKPARSRFAVGGEAKSTVTSKTTPRGGKTEKSRYKMNLEREIVLKARPRRRAKPRIWDRGWAFALGCIGLRVAFKYEKYRTTFRMPGVHAELDETPIGTFLELEGRPESIDRLARRLGFAPEEYIRATYYDLYVADRRAKGRPVSNMLFRG